MGPAEPGRAVGPREAEPPAAVEPGDDVGVGEEDEGPVRAGALGEGVVVAGVGVGRVGRERVRGRVVVERDAEQVPEPLQQPQHDVPLVDGPGEGEAEDDGVGREPQAPRGVAARVARAAAPEVRERRGAPAAVAARDARDVEVEAVEDGQRQEHGRGEHALALDVARARGGAVVAGRGPRRRREGQRRGPPDGQRRAPEHGPVVDDDVAEDLDVPDDLEREPDGPERVGQRVRAARVAPVPALEGPRAQRLEELGHVHGLGQAVVAEVVRARAAAPSPRRGREERQHPAVVRAPVVEEEGGEDEHDAQIDAPRAAVADARRDGEKVRDRDRARARGDVRERRPLVQEPRHRQIPGEGPRRRRRHERAAQGDGDALAAVQPHARPQASSAPPEHAVRVLEAVVLPRRAPGHGVEQPVAEGRQLQRHPGRARRHAEHALEVEEEDDGAAERADARGPVARRRPPGRDLEAQPRRARRRGDGRAQAVLRRERRGPRLRRPRDGDRRHGRRRRGEPRPPAAVPRAAREPAAVPIEGAGPVPRQRQTHRVARPEALVRRRRPHVVAAERAAVHERALP